MHDKLPCFLGFVNRVFHQSVAFTSLPSFFLVAETRNWHQDVVITRGVHFSASPDRRVDPSTAVGPWLLRTTNKALLETNRDDLASAEQIDTPP